MVRLTVSGTKQKTDTILVLNIGSTSAKLALFAVFKKTVQTDPLWQCHLSKTASGVTSQAESNGEQQKTTLKLEILDAIKQTIESVWNGRDAVLQGPEQICCIGHRVVHGGNDFRDATVIDAETLAKLKELTILAPLHEPSNIHGIEITSRLFSQTPQVAVFDTAYFADLPEAESIYALPYKWHELFGIKRYGFHGISHEYCSSVVSDILSSSEMTESPRIITCHLGGGTSITASKGTTALATTMGFTPLEGAVMSTRCGDIDPGILVFLLEQKKVTLSEISTSLNRDSGLKGISGLSGDVRELQESAQFGNKRAQLALDIYCQSVARKICAMLVATKGADAIVFTAGVGENSSYVRKHVAEHLSFLNFYIDHELNDAVKTDAKISRLDSSIKAFVIHTQEELMIAKESISKM